MRCGLGDSDLQPVTTGVKAVGMALALEYLWRPRLDDEVMTFSF